MNRRLLTLFVAVAAGAACGDTSSQATVQRSFDRPVDLAFGCYGRLRLLGDNGTPDPTDEIQSSPQPLSACAGRAFGGPDLTEDPSSTYVPNGQGEIPNSAVFWYAFAIQPTSGTMTVVSARVRGPADSDADRGYVEGSFAVDDSDPLIPGQNALVVGTNPVAITTDTAGCHVLTANAGTCDLSVIDIAAIPERDGAVVDALPVTVPAGPLLARPAAMVAADLASPVGVACPATPVGIHYLAYPDCHAVAAVDAATGAVVASIRFSDDGTAVLGGADLACPRQCGATRDPLIDGARPVTLDLVRDDRAGTQTLAIGLANRPAVTVVGLDAGGLPATVKTIDLEGEVGVTDLAVTRQITMGGTTGPNDGDAGTEAQFVYAVATDGTVRVAEVLVDDRECETQGDPRYLTAERDETKLICVEVGGPSTPPRRAGATGPGIHFASAARPVAVTVGRAVGERASGTAPSPFLLGGHFAYVALSTGFTVVINIDDDNYADTASSQDPLSAIVTSAVPHALRDGVPDREVTFVTPPSNGQPSFRACEAEQPLVATAAGLGGGPRTDEPPARSFASSQLAGRKSYMLPAVRQSVCTGDDGTALVTDLAFSADPVRQVESFPDWHALSSTEDWTFTWQGVLSRDAVDGSSAVDGPQVRAGTLDVGGGGISLVDGSRPFCGAGVEVNDIVTMRGCDPTRGNSQCGAGQICYLHPDSQVSTGACLPEAEANILAGLCRDYLISTRRFAVQEAFAGRLALRERKSELRTTPVGGCTSTEQCQTLATFEARLSSDAHPIDDTTAAPTATYTCEADPYRPTLGNRCVRTCQADDDCAAGNLCRGGRCLEGVVPSPSCVAGLQRYDLRAADALVAIGSRTGYLHPIVAAPDGRCVKDPTASPLLVGRVPLTAPPCAGPSGTALSPNPCTETVEHSEEVPDYVAGTCTLASATPRVATRTTTAVRFDNPLMRVRMVDLTYPGDAMCRGDRAGGLGAIPVLSTGMVLGFRVESGFLSVVAGGEGVVQPANVVRGPDESVWIVDAGDIDDFDSSTPNLRGQLLRVEASGISGALHVR